MRHFSVESIPVRCPAVGDAALTLLGRAGSGRPLPDEQVNPSVLK
jgi:hypothetical protein